MRAIVNLFLFALIIAETMSFSCVTEAETNEIPVVSTNVWTAMPWYREVNGKVYYPQHSALWKQLSGLAEIKAILPDAVVWQSCEDRRIFDDQGRLTAENRIYGKKFIIRHDSIEVYSAGPNGLEPTSTLQIGSESELKGLLVMYVGTTNYNGEVIPVWDCGEQVTNTTFTVISTNYPLQTNLNKP